MALVRVLGATFVVGAALFSSAQAADFRTDGLCAGYTVVERAYPPSTKRIDIVVKCPVKGGWKDWMVIKGVLAACKRGIAYDLKPQQATLTCR